MAKQKKDNAVELHKNRLSELQKSELECKQQAPDSAEAEFQLRRRQEKIGADLNSEAAALDIAAAQARVELSQPLIREKDELNKRAADRRDRFVRLMFDLAKLRRELIGDCGANTDIFSKKDFGLFFMQFKASLLTTDLSVLVSSPSATPEAIADVAAFVPESISEHARLREIEGELKRVAAMSVDELIAVAK